MEFSVKSVEIDGEEMKLQIWDTSGQEKYRTVTKSFYRKAMGAFIIFDLTNRESFEHLNVWLKMVEENAPEGTVKILLGNKTDMKKERVITPEEIRNFSNEQKIEYFEVSAKEGTGINEAFNFMAQIIKRDRIDQEIVLRKSEGRSVADFPYSLSARESRKKKVKEGCC